MRPEVMATLSRYLDGELSGEEAQSAETLLLSSEEARTYYEILAGLRRHIRQDPDIGPDVTSAVLAALETRRRDRLIRPRTIAAFAAGLAAGALFIGLAARAPSPIAAAEIPGKVLAAQTEVTSLTARLDVIERGWHPQVGERRFSGELSYGAPESLQVEIVDHTNYPSGEWVPNHSTQVVDGATSWTRAIADCPIEAQPDCTPELPRADVHTDREPFPDSFVAPLDLIVPVAGFTRAGDPPLIGVDTVAGRDTIGIEVTVAQTAALIDGILGAGNWRELHPTDRVELWLDQQFLVPLAFSVFPEDTTERALWAVRHGYADHSGQPILEVNWREVEINGNDRFDPPSPPAGASVSSQGFRDGFAAEMESLFPGLLPEGMALHRSGTTVTGPGPDVSVLSWSDGRAWLKIRWAANWTGKGLFGDLGPVVREVPVGEGVGYVDERGERVGLHGAGIDLVVLGSVPTATLIDIAESLDVIGERIPSIWVGAGSDTIAEAADAVEGLRVPKSLDGFAEPTVRAEPGNATLVYAGPGNRGFVLNVAADESLPPPLEANVRSVGVRGLDGRYSPDRGLLEWVEDGVLISLRSTTLSLDELITVAETLQRP